MSKCTTSFFCRFRGYLLLILMLLLICMLACIFGSAKLSIKEIVHGLLYENGYENQSIILYYLRIPRIIAGILAGIGLSISGVLLQSVTGNDLAGPNIIGVNAGAGFSCIALLAFVPHLWSILPFAAFVGAFITTVIIIAISQKIHHSGSTIILAGIAFTAVLNAGISFITLLDPDVLTSYNAFSIGSLNGVNIDQLIIPAIIIAISLFISLILSRQIAILSLGDSLASSLGVQTKRIRIITLVCASASAAAVVSFAGLLGFVGLVVPHISKRLTGNRTAPTLLVSSLVGAILVVASDLLGRILLSPTEIPVGILMALIGVPFFFVLLIRRRPMNA